MASDRKALRESDVDEKGYSAIDRHAEIDLANEGGKLDRLMHEQSADVASAEIQRRLNKLLDLRDYLFAIIQACDVFYKDIPPDHAVQAQVHNLKVQYDALQQGIRDLQEVHELIKRGSESATISEASEFKLAYTTDAHTTVTLGEVIEGLKTTTGTLAQTLQGEHLRPLQIMPTDMFVRATHPEGSGFLQGDIPLHESSLRGWQLHGHPSYLSTVYEGASSSQTAADKILVKQIERLSAHLTTLGLDKESHALTGLKKLDLPASDLLGMSFNRFKMASSVTGFVRPPLLKIVDEQFQQYESLAKQPESTPQNKLDQITLLETAVTQAIAEAKKSSRNPFSRTGGWFSKSGGVSKQRLPSLETLQNYVQDVKKFLEAKLNVEAKVSATPAAPSPKVKVGPSRSRR